MKLEECLNFLLTKTQQTVHQIFKAELDQYGVTPCQYALLKCLWTEDGLTARQLADRLSLDGSTVTGLLDRMESKELITKNTDPKDRRALNVQLTEKGRGLKAPLNEAIMEANQKALQDFDGNQIDSFKHFLKIAGKLENE